MSVSFDEWFLLFFPQLKVCKNVYKMLNKTNITMKLEKMKLKYVTASVCSIQFFNRFEIVWSSSQTYGK